jgi:thiosulfate dehydrogenase
MVWLVPLLVAMVWVALAQAAPASQAPASSIAKGGKLYDKWWKVAPGATEPKDDHPLWATQTTNKRKGSATWRCKECHGWDYKGKDGAYGSGSHKTGFVGVYNAASKKSQAELVAILKGSTNPKHDFSKVMDADSINDLANFLKEGLVDDAQLIDYASKKPKQANAAHGKELFQSVCAACHGKDGVKINFGSEEEPEYVGTVASDNPWEFLHKVRLGQPGAPMPSAIVSGWKTQDAVDVLAYAQTLPTEKPKALPKTGGPGIPVALLVGAAVALMGAGLFTRRLARR